MVYQNEVPMFQWNSLRRVFQKDFNSERAERSTKCNIAKSYSRYHSHSLGVLQKAVSASLLSSFFSSHNITDYRSSPLSIPASPKPTPSLIIINNTQATLNTNSKKDISW